MNETVNTQTAEEISKTPDIPENTLLNEPEYILKKKIGEAKRLIREDKLNFTQISDVLCFDNPHYFSTVFKRVTNMTPSEYKNSVKST